MKYLILLIFITLFLQVTALEIWVAPNGNDRNPGTEAEPLATLQMAQRKARELRRLKDPLTKDGISIVLKAGTYVLDEALFFRPEDSGTADSPTIVKSVNGEQVVLSGGRSVSGWQKAGSVKGLPKNARGNIWVAEAPMVGGHPLSFRQLWVDGVKASRAGTLSDGALPRILSVEKENQAIWIPKPDIDFPNTEQLEFVIHQWWAIANLRVKNIEVVGDKAKVTFHQPESRIEFEHPWPAPFIDEKNDLNGNSAFYLVNRIELLNAPGEWCLDEKQGKIYYWPRSGEDLSTAEVMVPYLETLVEFTGSLDDPVSYIQFQGINFQHTSWMRPSKKGHVPLQAGLSMLDAYRLQNWTLDSGSRWENHSWLERQAAAVKVKASNHIRFERCNFKHLAATGLDFIMGTHHNTVNGCVFTDVGGNGIMMGYFGGPEHESHKPYNPSDERELCRFEILSNNLIADVTNEDWGCVGICVGYAHDITIEHNEIGHVNYMGISLGWGWTSEVNCMKNNLVRANYIHHFARMMNDIGGIYTLSAQPNSLLSENRIESLLVAPYAHLPEHVQYLYFDEGTSYMRAENNWVEKSIFFENMPGPGNLWLNNNSSVDDQIKNRAGLTDEYKDLLSTYKENGLNQIVAADKMRKTIPYTEEYNFQEKGRGPK